MSDYPRFMCRSGTTEDAWGYRIDPGSADSPETEARMLAEGWHFLPGDWDKPENALLRAEPMDPERRRPGRPPKVRTEDNGIAELP